MADGEAMKRAEPATAIDVERERVREITDDLSGWRRWGPYVSDRSWGTVREDYETHGERAYGPGNASRKLHTKDAFHRAICERDPEAVRPDGCGTKAALHYQHVVPAGGSVTLRLRFTDQPTPAPLTAVDTIIAERKAEADVFYAGLAPTEASADERLVQRRALAGLLWTKQSYLFDVARWLDGDDPAHPPPASRRTIRNGHWRHLNSMRVMSMPDKWEYPWFAAWDLAFQCVPFALVDARFAKDQLWMLLFEQFQHPSGQLPAYEWEFGDLNPPVHAWAVWRVYNMDRIRNGHADREWLERCFHKLLINFASWVNKVDRDGNNVFEGGFLGLDNITVIDRSEPGAAGVVLEQSDATGWMGMFCLNLMRIALELARDNPVYEGMASKFLQHYVYVAHAAEPFAWGGRSVAYEPAESAQKLKGGNSNWRGPIWFPTTFLLIESLRKLGTAFGARYLVETPGSHGRPLALQAMARDIARRLIDIFLLDEHHRRPVYGGAPKFADDPHWRDHLLFYEYFHGDNGAGIGASHQTGWTALVANLIDEWR